MTDARDVIAKIAAEICLYPQSGPCDPGRHQCEASYVLTALAKAADDRYIVIDTKTGRLGKLEQEPLPYDYGFRWADSEGT